MNEVSPRNLIFLIISLSQGQGDQQILTWWNVHYEPTEWPWGAAGGVESANSYQQSAGWGKNTQDPQPCPKQEMGFQPLVLPGMCHTFCAVILEAPELSIPEYVHAVINGDGRDIVIYSCFILVAAPVSLFPADVAFSNSWLCSWFIPTNFFSEDRKGLLPFESENWLPPVSRLLGAFCTFARCEMREENTTKIYLEQHKKNCLHDPCKDGNVSIWNGLQTIKIMNRWTLPVGLSTACACSSKCWPPHSIKIRISAVFVDGEEWCAHNQIPIIGSTQFTLSPLLGALRCYRSSSHPFTGVNCRNGSQTWWEVVIKGK